MVVSQVAVKIPPNPRTENSLEQDNSFSNQILILFSAPLLDEDLLPVENLSIQQEIEAIALVLKNISHPLAVEIVVKVATSQTLQDVFSSRVKPLIIHFIGHGMKEGDSTALVLENEVGMTRSFSEEELKIALSNQKQAPCQLALLNACHSEKLAQAFVTAGVSHVIGVGAEDKILDVAAQCFSKRLYLAEDFNLLVEFLDGYPLAIQLAASYMQETKCTLKMLHEGLIDEPLEVLAAFSHQERKERSLRITLDRSFKMLSVEGQDIFPLLAFFPSGLSRDLARAIWGRSGNRALLELFKFSMAEKSPTASDWRVNLPEPARTYAKSRLQNRRGLDYLAPKVLDFYHGNFCTEVIKIFRNRDDKKGQNLLLQENSNLILFLEWGYKHEISLDRVCRSARITALLSDYWRWIEPNKDPLIRLDLALVTAQRNQDIEGEELVKNTIAALSAQGEFKDIQSLGQESDQLKSFDFETVTVNHRGEIIERETKQTQYFNENFGEDITLEMVVIPGGIFMMGSLEGEGYNSEKPQHEVIVESFRLGKYPVTQAQWKAVSAFTQANRELKPNPSYFTGDNHPVERVSWEDAVEFCDRLSQYTGRTYRLPSEAEWEYACRAGTTTPFHFGETITTDLANYDGNSTYGNGVKGVYRKETTEVGSFGVANNFGLYDMHGNVWEWCQDNWHSNYEGAPTDGNAWLDNEESSDRKLLRGGSWHYDPDYCRSAYRHYNCLGYYVSNIGFRVVCSGAART
jgi:formylglycine-generating enzyme required for sulfatase activity